MSNVEQILSEGGCVSVAVDGSQHGAVDRWGKEHGYTVVYAGWHPEPEYRIFRTGSLMSRNEEYPSGLVLMDEQGRAQPWKAERQA